ncbi:MAG: sensor histidine kinase [Elainellaceae cyanobacterium]
MFQTIRYRLLASYLAVLTIILAVFAVAVRITFVRVLDHQLDNRLETLAKAASLELELEGAEISVDNEPLVNENQAIQWFDYEGNLVDDQGEYVMTSPLDPNQTIQTQDAPYPAKGLTIPVNDYGKDIFIGYVRVSESTQAMDNTLRSLDLGLGISVGVALVLSWLGGIWLTRQAMKPIEQSFRRLQRFTSDAAHELRSPLAAIKTNAAVALKYQEGMRSTDAEKFQAIKSASTQLTALTENLLTLARTDQHVFQEKDIIDLADLFKPLVQLYQPQFDDKAVQLKAYIKTGLRVLGDVIQLNRLFTNLIDNALRYTPTGGLVEVTAERDDHRLSIHIKDTGIGIAPDQLDYLFERFWQADQARSYQAGGFGLGLAIAQGIAHNHGGEIQVTSTLGQGSCFTVHLPSTS